ncbi:hypothetical protein KW850_19950 [Bacillus sp. sid0103]|nr:hypothetical protein [Bacillus sp. sid0103]
MAMLIGAKGVTPAGVRGWGDPTGAKRRGGSPCRPQTARAWSANQHTGITQPNGK